MAAIWATPKDVEDLTGAIANEGEIAIAQAIVDLYADLDSDRLDLEMIFPKDLQRLKKATAYQTKFMQGQPELLSRQKVKAISQDGVSATYTEPDDVILAPLATLAISKLRWKRSRALHPNRRGRNMLALQQTWVRDSEPGAELGWSSISPGGR